MLLSHGLQTHLPITMEVSRYSPMLHDWGTELVHSDHGPLPALLYPLTRTRIGVICRAGTECRNTRVPSLVACSWTSVLRSCWRVVTASLSAVLYFPNCPVSGLADHVSTSNCVSGSIPVASQSTSLYDHRMIRRSAAPAALHASRCPGGNTRGDPRVEYVTVVFALASDATPAAEYTSTGRSRRALGSVSARSSTSLSGSGSLHVRAVGPSCWRS